MAVPVNGQARTRYQYSANAPMTKAESVVEQNTMPTPPAMPLENRPAASSSSGSGSKSPSGRASADMASPAQVD